LRQGVITKSENSDVFDIPAFIAKSNGNHSPSTEDSIGKATPSLAKEDDLHANFKPLDETLVADYVKSHPQLETILGGTSADWSVKEVGDGNLNFVYILQGPKGSFVLKQVMVSRKRACRSCILMVQTFIVVSVGDWFWFILEFFLRLGSLYNRLSHMCVVLVNLGQ